MANHPRLRNISVFLVLVLLFAIPAVIVNDNKRMMDLVSIPMLVYGLYAFAMIVREAWHDFWAGNSGRSAFALFGLSLVFSSIDMMRTYGLLTRNAEMLAPYIPFVPVVDFAHWLDNKSYFYAIAIYMQFVGIWFFTRASFQPTIPSRAHSFGRTLGVLTIGLVIGSSKVLEPVLAAIGKVVARLLGW